MYPKNRYPYLSFTFCSRRFFLFLTIITSEDKGIPEPQTKSDGIDIHKMYHRCSSSQHLISYCSTSHCSPSIYVQEKMDNIARIMLGCITNKTMIIVETSWWVRYSCFFLNHAAIPQNNTDNRISIIGSIANTNTLT